MAALIQMAMVRAFSIGMPRIKCWTMTKKALAVSTALNCGFIFANAYDLIIGKASRGDSFIKPSRRGNNVCLRSVKKATFIYSFRIIA
jgi:hypothetical protein